jgi:hypothetical protein
MITEPEATAADGLDIVHRLVRREPWMADGLCVTRDLPVEVFFPTRGQDVDMAKQVCAPCPVRVECLEYALDGGEAFGIWGGTSERERRRIRRRRGLTDMRRVPAAIVDAEHEKRTRALWLRQQGWRPREIAAELGVTDRTIHRWLEDKDTP